MVANPLYGREPDTDTAQLRALRLVPRGDWRGPGCSDFCVRVFAEVMGGGGREVIEAHDGSAHEAYVHSLYVPEIVRTGCLTIDISAGRVWVGGEEVTPFQPASWQILKAMSAQLGTVLSKRALWKAMHGDDSPMIIGDSYFGQLVNLTRKRLGPAAPLLETRFSLGYLLRAEPPVGTGGER